MKVSGKEFLENMSITDSLLSHSIEICGNCYYQYIIAQIARDMLKNNDTEGDVVTRWNDEIHRRWQNSKYYKLNLDICNGIEPKDGFEKRGWIK